MRGGKSSLLTAILIFTWMKAVINAQNSEKDSMTRMEKRFLTNFPIKSYFRQRRESIAFEEEDFNPNGGYGPWSRWSPCSRLCGAGQATRTRKCHDVMRCHAGNVELRLCFHRKCRSKRTSINLHVKE